MKRRQTRKQPDARAKQLDFGFCVPQVAVPVAHFELAPRWAPTPSHVFGKEVAVLHPRGWARVLRIVDHDNRSVAAIWPNAGGRVDFDLTTGKAYARGSAWRVSPEDIAWFAGAVATAVPHDGEEGSSAIHLLS
jgi:hypothetical protein